MRLDYFTVTNYRSITSAYKIRINDATVLLGKNNEGKTNILKALMLSWDILRNAEFISKRGLPMRRTYIWQDDYPISLQKAKKADKKTSYRMDFVMTPAETNELFAIIGSRINDTISIFIELHENNRVSITVPKRGKNTKSLSNKIVSIAKYICSNIDYQYVPAIRSERDALNVISELVETELSDTNDEEYLKAQDYIEKYQDKKLKALSERIKKPLSNFLPKIKKINIGITDRYSRTLFRRDVDIELDDGVKTSLTNKGDGVKSLITIALLSQVRATKNRIIIVDEPENHLHPEAIHYIKDVLYNIPKNNQVLIATHNPILVNRTDVKSNIIVENNEAKPAQKIDEIRNSLGVLTSDNLQYADYVIVVEGPTDKAFIESYVKTNKPSLQKYIQSNKMQIRSIGGTNNLMYELCGLERYFCNYIVLLDNDSAGKTAKEKAVRELNIDGNRFRFFVRTNGKDTELEDLYLDSVYEEYMVAKGICVICGEYKNKSRKWVDRIKSAATASGFDITKDIEYQYKQDIVNIVISDINASITPQAKDLLDTIFTYIEDQIQL